MTQEYQFDTTPRNDNRVKERLDGQGDGWGNQHRESLEKQYYFQDIDALFGTVVFGQNTGEKLFLEYVPDGYQHRTQKVRQFGIVALFDRKTSAQAAFAAHNRVSCSLYLWLCRALAKPQPVAPKFFYVIGDQSPPWTMIELDIETGEEINQRTVLQAMDWAAIWQRLGLTTIRNELVRWLR